MATASSAVGTYAFTLGSLTAGANYTLVLDTSSPTLAVTPVQLIIAPGAGQSKVYEARARGGPHLQTATGFVSGDSSSLLTGAAGATATSGSAVGANAFTLGSLSAGPNYTLALAASSPTLAVTPEQLTITPAAGQSKAYGAAVPALTATATGFAGGDSSSLADRSRPHDGHRKQRSRDAVPFTGSAFRTAGPTTTWHWPPSSPTLAVTPALVDHHAHLRANPKV